MLGLQFFASSRPLVPNGSAQFPISGETGELTFKFIVDIKDNLYFCIREIF